MKCRNCKSNLQKEFINLGKAPLSNGYKKNKKNLTKEKTFQLRVLVCEKCWLVQTDDKVQYDEIFDKNYAYFSSFSKTWLNHSKKFADNSIKRFNLDSHSLVSEVASNDGYLLKFFQKSGIPCIGIEPTESTCISARKKGIETIKEFFSSSLARKLRDKSKTSDLIIANNVLAHVPNIKDFVKGFSILLKPNGVATFEFPHIVNLIKRKQFDTIYHEHFSYLSLISVNSIFKNCGLKIFDVQKIPTHGGSLRVYAQKKVTGNMRIRKSVSAMMNYEKEKGINSLSLYKNFQSKADKISLDLKKFLDKAVLDKKRVIAYGAAAKGNTLLNYAGIKNDIIEFVVDENPAKQNHFMPGSGIPIVGEANIRRHKPDYIIILPWNLKDEIKLKLKYIRSWEGKFVTAIPRLLIS